MNFNKIIGTIALATLALAACLDRATAADPLKINFSKETVGAEPTSFLNVVGIWRIEAEGDHKILAVDGRQWKEGQTSAGGGRQGAGNLRRAIRRVPRPGAGLCLFPVHRGQGRA